MRIIALVGHLTAAAARLTLRLVVHAWLLQTESRATTVGRTLAELMQRLGPTYVKLGQIVATRQDLVGEPVAVELARLQDRLSPVPSDVVREQFRNELGLTVEEAFTSFDDNPMGSASIASVFKAQLADGRVVAVKVRRPALEQSVAADLRLLDRGARILQWFPPLRDLPLRQAAAEFSECVMGQLDFRREVQANRRVAAALSHEPGLVLPQPVDDLCSESIITMEYIADLDSAEPPSPAALRTALRALYRMIFVDGLIHCDLHAGNMKLFSDGRVAMIDFGFMAELERPERLKFAEFFYSLGESDGARCADIILETASARRPNLAEASFRREVESLVRAASGATVREFEVARFVTGLFAIQRRHGVTGTTAFTMAIVSLLVLEGAAKQVDPTLRFQIEAKPFIFRGSIRRDEPTVVSRDARALVVKAHAPPHEHARL